MTKRYDVIVVGAGHNGLTTAFYLAKAKLNTLARYLQPFFLEPPPKTQVLVMPALPWACCFTS